MAHVPIRDKGASFPGGLLLAVAERILHLKNAFFVLGDLWGQTFRLLFLTYSFLLDFFLFYWLVGWLVG